MRRYVPGLVEALAVMVWALGGWGSALAGEAGMTTVRVNVFPGISNLGLYAAQAQGMFAKRGLNAPVEFTPNSQAQREGLAAGKFEIAHAAVDNAIAMIEVAKAEAVIILGGDGSLNNVYVQPDVASIPDLRGKTVIVDAPNTAYALQLYKILKLNGLQKGDYTVKVIGGTSLRLEAMRKEKAYAATMMNPPFSVLAEKEGLRNMGSAVQMIGPYQGPGAFVMRGWAQAHPEVLVRYIQGFVEGLRWAMDPANKDRAVALLAERLKLAPDVALKCYEIAADPGRGFAKDARFDIEGFKNTLKLRAEIEGQWGGTPPPPDKYFDLSYYQRAMAGLN
jgi:ABC-type nitrate/sulfonate/bicarbonate transport system substrate-binding protein